MHAGLVGRLLADGQARKPAQPAPAHGVPIGAASLDAAGAIEPLGRVSEPFLDIGLDLGAVANRREIGNQGVDLFQLYAQQVQERDRLVARFHFHFSASALLPDRGGSDMPAEQIGS